MKIYIIFAEDNDPYEPNTFIWNIWQSHEQALERLKSLQAWAAEKKYNKHFYIEEHKAR